MNQTSIYTRDGKEKTLDSPRQRWTACSKQLGKKKDHKGSSLKRTSLKRRDDKKKPVRESKIHEFKNQIDTNKVRLKRRPSARSQSF